VNEQEKEKEVTTLVASVADAGCVAVILWAVWTRKELAV
jgi:hypothetical protein